MKKEMKDGRTPHPAGADHFADMGHIAGMRRFAQTGRFAGAALSVCMAFSVCAALSAGMAPSVRAASADAASDAASFESPLDMTSFAYPLDEASAQEIALYDANAKQEDAERLRTKADRENGEDVIEVDFYFENNEYEYTIRTSDGMILEWQIEGRDVSDAVAELSLTGGTAAGSAAQTDAASDAEVQTEAAGGAEVQTEAAGDSAAQTNAAGGAEAQTEAAGDSAAQTDAAAGAAQTPAEFVTADGTVLVGLEQAKEAVRADMQDADSLLFAKVHFECERSYYEYEFEVYAGGREYEYTVDAQTGEVLFREMDD